MSRPVRPIEDRFWEKTAKAGPDDCWNWQATKNNHGYGMLSVSAAAGKMLAHRFSYELATGRSPRGFSVLHSCDNPACVNPHHLRLGTHKDNSQDMRAKGRWANAGHKGSEIGTSKLNERDVVAIRASYLSHKPIREIMAEFGIARATIKGIVAGRTWRHLLGTNGQTAEVLQASRRPSGWRPPA